MKRVSYIYEATYPSLSWLSSRVRFLATTLEITRINHSYVFTEKFLPTVGHDDVHSSRIYVTPSRKESESRRSVLFSRLKANSCRVYAEIETM